MKKFLFFTIACFVGIAGAAAAVRSTNSVDRTSTTTVSNGTNVVARSGRTNNTSSTNVKPRLTSTTARNDAQTTVARTTTNARSSSVQQSTAKRATTARTATARTASANTVNRAAITSRDITNQSTRPVRSAARAVTVAPSTVTNTFGTDYNTCRNAYFTCMDQFCATANDSYRRCICSSRLTDILERQRALNQTSDQLADFHNLNIEVIPKTAAEVNAMLTATEGELAITEDQSESAQQLKGIRDILTSAKQQALSTLGTLDIAGDINQIWATTDLASGENIANLTGEALYNAVHAQCMELIADQCQSQSTLNMVVSAYGMYIENDCSLLFNALDKQQTQANSTIRETEREMNLARLENYNAHNSTSINDCIAQVRIDITSESACGPDYVHCLDITGRYLNRDTGEPIYSRDFYQLANQTSLDGNVLTNATNRMLVAELNSKRIYAERGLETCRDIADEVWDEFVRQAIVEIYQGQQEKIRDVKNECMDVVNKCYDEQSNSLKDFSNVKEELLLGQRLELSEELCEEKLYTCSNLYGDPNGNGLELLLAEMHNITDQKIVAQCQSLLTEFAKSTCAVPSNDSLHSYPYGCRAYAPGDAIYASNWFCNQLQWSAPTGNSGNTGGNGTIVVGPSNPLTSSYSCLSTRTFSNCNTGYYMAFPKLLATTGKSEWEYNGVPQKGNSCLKCPSNCQCPGGTQKPKCINSPTEPGETPEETPDCGTDYAGSLYQKMVKYAAQVCVRPSEYESITAGLTAIPTTVLQDVNVVMDSVRVDMSKELSAECERLGGLWVDTQWVDEINNDTKNETPDGKHDKTGHEQFKTFYDETGSNTKWGYCASITKFQRL